MEPTSNSFDCPTQSSLDQWFEDSLVAHSADVERKAMIRDVQAIAKRLSAFKTQDIVDLEDPTSCAASIAAEMLTEMVTQMEAILAAPPTELEWDKNYKFKVVVSGFALDSVTVNPFCDTRLSKSEWADVRRKEYLLQAIARKKFVESISIEPA